MSHLLSSGLLAASMLLGQSGEPPAGTGKTVVPTPPIVQPMVQPAPKVGWFNREDRPILNKIQSWFRRDQPEAPPQPKYVQPTKTVIRETPTPTPPPITNPAPTDFPRKLPNPQSKGITLPTPAPIAKDKPAPNVQQTTLQQQPVSAPTVVPKGAKTPILPSLANKIGRDEKFEWITGQIVIENKNYVLYYATPETIDKYNGRVVLQPQQVDMSQFRPGDLVSVRGQIVQRGTAGALYRLSSASLIERPKS